MAMCGIIVYLCVHILSVCVFLCLSECVWWGYWSNGKMLECQPLFSDLSLTQFTGIAGFELVSRVNLAKLY